MKQIRTIFVWCALLMPGMILALQTAEQKLKQDSEQRRKQTSDMDGSMVIIPGQVPEIHNNFYQEYDQDGNPLPGSGATSPVSSPRSSQDSHLNDSYVDVPSLVSQTSLSSLNSSNNSAPSPTSVSQLTSEEIHKRSRFIVALKKEVITDAQVGQLNQNNEDVAGEYNKFLENFADTMSDATREYDKALHNFGLWYFFPRSIQPASFGLRLLRADTQLQIPCLELATNANNNSIRWAAGQIAQNSRKVAHCAREVFSRPPTFVEAFQKVSTTTKATLGLSVAAVIIIPAVYFSQKAASRRAITT